MDPGGTAPASEIAPTGKLQLRQGCRSKAAPVSTLDRSKAMRRASSYSESTSSSEQLLELDIASDSIRISEGRGKNGAREESE